MQAVRTKARNIRSSIEVNQGMKQDYLMQKTKRGKLIIYALKRKGTILLSMISKQISERKHSKGEKKQ